MSAYKGLEVVSLFEASQDQLDDFTKRVENAGNKAEIFVHPLYVSQDWYDPRFDLDGSSFFRQRGLYLYKAIDNQEPLVVLHPQASLDNLEARLNTREKRTLFVIPTYPNDPFPYKHNWDEVIAILKQSGVKDAEVGGVFLYLLDTERQRNPNFKSLSVEQRQAQFSQVTADVQKLRVQKPGELLADEWVNLSLYPDGCVGITCRKLVAGGIDVALSSVSLPGFAQIL